MATKIVLDDMKAKQKAIKDAIAEAKKFADANGLTFDFDLDGLYSATYHGKAHPLRKQTSPTDDDEDTATENGYLYEVIQGHRGWLSSSMTC